MTHLEQMPAVERTRWVEFLSYIVALVYHARSEGEQPELRDVVDRSVQIDPHRKEYAKMGRTIAEMYIDQGRKKGRIEGKLEGKLEGELERARMILLRQLRKRFKKVPRKVEARITATTNMHELETWLDKILDAESLDEVGIPPK